MVAGHAWSEVLRRFDAAGSGLDRQPGERDRRARTAGISVEDLVANENALRRIGVLDVHLVYVGGRGHGFGMGRKGCELQVDGQRTVVANDHRLADIDEIRGLRYQPVRTHGKGREAEPSVEAGVGFHYVGVMVFHHTNCSCGNRLPLGVGDLAGNAAGGRGCGGSGD